MLQPETASTSERRRHRSESRQRRDDSSDTRRRQIEHQSSIRSLIGSSDVESLDMDREVEEFARQIQEEGLLDGLDLDNIDLTNNDELSRKITEAYRRRQRERTRHDGSRRSNASGASRNSDPLISETRPHPPSSSRSNQSLGSLFLEITFCISKKYIYRALALFFLHIFVFSFFFFLAKQTLRIFPQKMKIGRAHV